MYCTASRHLLQVSAPHSFSSSSYWPVEKEEPSPLGEMAWDVDQGLIAQLKEQYRKERKGKKGVKSKSSTRLNPLSSLCLSLCRWILQFTKQQLTHFIGFFISLQAVFKVLFSFTFLVGFSAELLLLHLQSSSGFFPTAVVFFARCSFLS